MNDRLERSVDRFDDASPDVLGLGMAIAAERDVDQAHGAGDAGGPRAVGGAAFEGLLLDRGEAVPRIPCQALPAEQVLVPLGAELELGFDLGEQLSGPRFRERLGRSGGWRR